MSQLKITDTEAIKYNLSLKNYQPVSNLQQDSRFSLNRTESNSGFLRLFYQKIKLRKPHLIWLSLACSVLFPKVIQKNLNRREVKERAGLFRASDEVWSACHLSRYTSVFIQGDHASITVPVYAFAKGVQGVLSAVKILSSNEIKDFERECQTVHGDHLNSQTYLEGKAFDLSSIPSNGNTILSPADLICFREMKGSLFFKSIAGEIVMFFHFQIPKKQCQFLVNSPWASVRSMDVYGIINEWVLGYFGSRGKPSKYSIPLSQIRATLPKGGVSRQNEEGLFVDEHGCIQWLPHNVDEVQRFEDRFIRAYTHENGTFGRFDIVDLTKSERKPPPACPVFLDWVNLKFAYTTEEGRLMVLNLDRCVRVNSTHLTRSLSRCITNDRVKSDMSFIIRLSRDLKGPDVGTDVSSLINQAALIGTQMGHIESLDDLKVYMMYEYACADTSSSLFKFLQACAFVDNVLRSNPENAYERFSVLNVMHFGAFARLFTFYAPKYKELRKQDEESRSPYLNASIDPTYSISPVPLLSEGRAALPHQYKVFNITRQSPDHIIYPVDAGGGKSFIAIYDMLKEMAAGSTGPFVFMCPAHLIANYIDEFVYFTEGRVNVIPVTTRTINRHGFQRLKQMIDTAPVNTVIITDYNSILLRNRRVAYGVASTQVFPVIEFIRQFRPQYIMCDEAHYLRNRSSRQSAAHRLISDIKKKRLASGTLVTNTVIDLSRQVSVMDSTVFGTDEDFIGRYALEVVGGKVLSWKPGAEASISSEIRSNFLVAEARRKEWAAILPTPVEKFHPTDLTENQQKVYDQIIQESYEELKAAVEADDRLKKIFWGDKPAATDLGLSEDEEEVSIPDGEEEENSQIMMLLRPYLARLERFVTAPGKDKAGVLLQGDDLTSPKAKKIVEICKKHLEENLPGKVLIFTNYQYSAEAIYELLENTPELKGKSIYYTAERKAECGAQAVNDDSKRIMVGIEASMNTGLNLQCFSRLIRCETVWTPGILEQGNARIGRPNIKVAETRTCIYYDWIVANQTIDITKISYLIAKIISKSKYDEAGNPRFDELETPPLFPMTLETILSTNTFEVLVKYFDAYNAYKQATFKENHEYREKYKSFLFTEDGSLRRFPVPTLTTVPLNSSLCRRLPYVPGMRLNGADQLHLVRYDEFLRLNPEDLSDSDEDDDTGSALSALAYERTIAIGKRVHTERGDGFITGVSKSTVKVQMDNPSREMSFGKMTVFIVDNYRNREVKPKDYRPYLLSTSLNDTGLVIGPKINLVDGDVKDRSSSASSGLAAEFEFTVVNDFLGIRLKNTENPELCNILQNSGFRYSPEYYAARISSPSEFRAQFSSWQENGFACKKNFKELCRSVYDAWKKRIQGKINGKDGIAYRLELDNPYRMEVRPDPVDTHLYPYPMIQDGDIYLVLPGRGHPGSSAQCNLEDNPVDWFHYEAGSELIGFTSKKANVLSLFNSLEEKGVTIVNRKNLESALTKAMVYRNIV